jgi:hypothetical protein
MRRGRGATRRRDGGAGGAYARRQRDADTNCHRTRTTAITSDSPGSTGVDIAAVGMSSTHGRHRAGRDDLLQHRPRNRARIDRHLDQGA